MPEPSKAEHAAQQEVSPAGCLLRLFWMIFGNAAWLVAWLGVARSERVGSADAMFAGVTAALVLARYVDIAKLGGTTVNADPATVEHFRRYALLLVMLSLIGWGVARAIAW